MKEFNIVLCDDTVFKKHYKKSYSIEIINHKDILSKLETNDIYKEKPTTDILKFVLITRIKKSINSKKIESIFYKIDSINFSIIQSLKLVIGVYFDEITLNLILHEDTDVSDIAHNFNEIMRIK